MNTFSLKYLRLNSPPHTTVIYGGQASPRPKTLLPLMDWFTFTFVVFFHAWALQLKVYYTPALFLLFSALDNLYFFFKDLVHLFLERGEGRENERERNNNVWLPLTWPPLETWPAAQVRARTGKRTGDPLVLSLCSSHWATPSRAQVLLLFKE